MAAIRSALLMLGRRSCGSSASSAAASLGGRGPEIHAVFRSAATRTPPPPSLCLPGHSLESWRCFSTGSRTPADKAENGLRMRFLQWIDDVKNDAEVRAKFAFWYLVVVLGSSTCFHVKKVMEMRRIDCRMRELKY